MYSIAWQTSLAYILLAVIYCEILIGLCFMTRAISDQPICTAGLLFVLVLALAEMRLCSDLHCKLRHYTLYTREIKLLFQNYFRELLRPACVTWLSFRSAFVSWMTGADVLVKLVFNVSDSLMWCRIKRPLIFIAWLFNRFICVLPSPSADFSHHCGYIQ